MTLTFLRISVQVFCRMSLYWNWMFFSWYNWGYRLWERNPQNLVPFLSYHIKSTYYQHDLWLLCWPWSLAEAVCLLVFYTVFFFPFGPILLGRKLLCVTPKIGEFCSLSLKVKYLHKWFGILLHGSDPVSPLLILFNHLLLYQYESWILIFYFGL